VGLLTTFAIAEIVYYSIVAFPNTQLGWFGHFHDGLHSTVYGSVGRGARNMWHFIQRCALGALKGALKEGHEAVEELAGVGSREPLLNEEIENEASPPVYSVSHVIR
jgi:hypothetical protein